LTKIINIKEFANFLRVHRNSIVTQWLEIEEVNNIFSKYSFPIVDKNINLFYEFCDCFVSFIEYDFSIEQCPARNSLLNLFNNYHIDHTELFLLVLKLKSSIEKSLFMNGYLSYGLQNELESFTIKLANELVETYSQIQGNKENYKNEQNNLLSEYKKAVDLSNIVSKTNPKGIITYVNDKFCEISGYKRNELIGKPHNIIRHPDMEREAFKDLWDTIKNKKPWQGVVTNMKKDGLKYIVDTNIIPILDVDGDVVEYIAVRHDITELEETKRQLKKINTIMKTKVDELYSVTTSLEEQASVDSLTGIYNRNKFEDLFTEQLKKSKKDDIALSLIIFDIDHFKEINDTYGHQAGDIVLQELVSLISKNIKISDVFARWGGEEFVILLPETTLDGSFLFAEKLRKLIQANNFSAISKLTTSFGVGELHQDENKTTFFEKVDKALYMAKNNGRNRVEKALIGCTSQEF
jgi:diguanylate cyclase (GGDEF)-like protein/PAS domain S-box-containing protein